MIEIAVVLGGLMIIIYLFYKDYKKDRDFNKAIQKCKIPNEHIRSIWEVKKNNKNRKREIDEV